MWSCCSPVAALVGWTRHGPPTTDVRASVVGAHELALVGAIRWALNFCIVFVAIVWVLIELSLPPSALVPLASVVGVGLGFGAQQIVGDVLTGFFILSERQFGVGDLIRIGPLMSVGWVEGRVEEMTLRVTKVRTFDGDLVTIANGELRQSVNASRDWARGAGDRSAVARCRPRCRDDSIEQRRRRTQRRPGVEAGHAGGAVGRRPRRSGH